MFIKTLRTLGAAALISTVSAPASAVTISTPVELAKKQADLSEKIVTNYTKHKDISQVLHRLEEQQMRLKKSIHDPEISNMLDFLQLCLENIKSIQRQPRTMKNAEKIADLSASMHEGNFYIFRKLN